MFQNPYGSLNPRRKVEEILAEPLVINTGTPAAGRGEAVAEMMRKVGLREEQAERWPHMFSGGQRQRIAIARALILRPGLVVLDEPVSALDLSIQAQVLNLLQDLQDELGLAYLFISHDLSVVRHLAHDLMVMYFGRAVEQGSQRRHLRRAAAPLHPRPPRRLPGRRPVAPRLSRQGHPASSRPPCARPPAASSTPAARCRTPAAARRCRSCSR